jgi:hemolysin activation/secretion protein
METLLKGLGGSTWLRSCRAAKFVFPFAIALCAAIAPGDALSQSRINRQAIFTAADIQGATVYGRDEIWAYAANQAAAETGQFRADAIAAAIQQLYRQDGYFLATVTYRADPRSGAVTFVVNEGRIGHVEIQGVDDWIAAAIHGRIVAALGAGPVRLAEFERGLMLAGDLAGIQVRSELEENAASGAHVLKLSASAARQRGALTIDNPPRRFGRTISASLSQQFFSTLVPGDMLRFNVAGSRVFRENDGALYGGAYYRMPLTPNGAYAEVYGGNTIARRDLSGTLEDTQQRGLNLVGLVGYPLIRDAHQFLYLLLEFEHIKARSRSNTLAYTSSASALRPMLVYSHAWADGASSKLVLTGSTGWTDDTAFPGQRRPDRNFWHVRGHIGHVQPLDGVNPGLAIRFEAAAQFTGARLPSVETFFLGDRNRLRGYRFAEFEGDSGVTATAELSQHINVGQAGIRAVRPYAFVDAGMIRSRSIANGRRDDHVLYSAGGGLRFDFTAPVTLQGWIGAPLSRGASGKVQPPAAYVSLSTYW